MMSQDKKVQVKGVWTTDLKNKTRNPTGYTDQSHPNISPLPAHVQGAGGHWPDTGLGGALAEISIGFLVFFLKSKGMYKSEKQKC